MPIESIDAHAQIKSKQLGFDKNLYNTFTDLHQDEQVRIARNLISLSAQRPNIMIEEFQLMCADQQLSILSQLFVQWCKKRQVTVHPSFLSWCVHRMEHLVRNGKENVIEGLARGFAEMRPDGSDSRLPVKRMPFGLISYCVDFFNAKSKKQVCSYKSTLCTFKCSSYPK